MATLSVKVVVDTDTDRFAVWRPELGWVEFVMPELVAQVEAETLAVQVTNEARDAAEIGRLTTQAEEILAYLTETHAMKVKTCQKTAISSEDWQFAHGYGAAVADLRARLWLSKYNRP
jgi:RPA family protein